jgi:hypothetical protein
MTQSPHDKRGFACCDTYTTITRGGNGFHLHCVIPVNLKSNPRVFDNLYPKKILTFHSWDLFSTIGFCILVKFHTKKKALVTTHKMGMCRRKLESKKIRKKHQSNKAKKKRGK